MANGLPIKFTALSKPSSYLLCTECNNVFDCPMIIVRCGHTFCRKCIETRLKNSNFTCPIDSGPCRSADLVLNKALEGQIDDLEIYCRYGLSWSAEGNDYVIDPNGCQEKITLGTRKSHETSCPHSRIPCPNNTDCGHFKRNELDGHLSLCKKHKCVHHEKGCPFIGDRTTLDEHHNVCGYRGLITVEGGYGDKIKALQLENAALRTTVHVLNEKVDTLEKFKATASRQLEQCISALTTVQEKLERLETRRETESPLRRTSSVARRSHWVMPFNFKCIGSLKSHEGEVVALASQGSRLFSGGGDKTIKVWDLDVLGKGCIYTMKGHIDTVHVLTVGGSFLYSAGADFTLRCWNLEGYEEVNCIQNAHSNVICAMVYTGDYLFTSSLKVIKVWELRTLKLLHTIDGLHHWVRALAVSPAKDKVYSGSHNTIEIWDCTGKFSMRGKLNHEFGSVYSLLVTSQYIIAGTENNLHIFDAISQKPVRKLQAHVGAISCLLANPPGMFVISASVDQSVQIWNLENMLPIQTLRRHQGAVNSLALHGDMLITGSADHEIKVFLLLKLQMGYVPVQ